jgi:hypothetical protein
MWGEGSQHGRDPHVTQRIQRPPWPLGRGLMALPALAVKVSVAAQVDAQDPDHAMGSPRAPSVARGLNWESMRPASVIS